MFYYGSHIDGDDEYNKSNLLDLVKEAKGLDANCVQIFLRSPNNTRKDGIRPYTNELAKKIKEYLKKNKMKMFIHASYMANLGVPPEHQFKYRSELVIEDLKKSVKLGASGVVLHLGTRNNSRLGFQPFKTTLKNFTDSIRYILDNTPKSSILILETSAGDGSKIGGCLAEFAKIYQATLRAIKPGQRKRLKICIDTCHIFVAGNDIKTTKTWVKYLAHFDREIGLKNIILFHLNDSLVPFDSKKDRHTGLKQGYIFDSKKGGNEEILKTIILTAYSKKIPIILETHSDYTNEIKYIAKIIKDYKTKTQKGGLKKKLKKIKRKDHKPVIIKNLEELSKIRGAVGNYFRQRSYNKVVKQLKELDYPINEFSDLKYVKGIGKSIKLKIEEIIETGTLKQLKELKKTEGKKTKALSELQSVMGIGPTMSKRLYKNGITTISQLKKAVKNNKVELNETQEIGLKYYKELQKKIRRKETKETANKLQMLVSKLYPGSKIYIAGSYRTGKKESKDMDFILTIPEIKTKKDIKHKYLKNIMEEIRKEHDLIYQMSLGANTSMFLLCQNGNIRHIDLKLSSLDTLVEHMFYFASGAEFNRRIRLLAKEQGYKLSEWGLFKGKKRIFIPKTEKEIFEYLNIPYQSPKKRYKL